MQPHQERVLVERERTEGDIAKLAAFLESEKAKTMDQHERWLMVKQLGAMREYSACLAARINHWRLNGET